MAKNILIYSDGTGQIGGLRPEQRLTNIYKMYRASKIGPENNIDPTQQVAFYDPGLGSEENGSFGLHPVKSIRKVLSGVFGVGLSTNIIDCYEAILKYYEPGDRIYLFGFSRGAYTVRCLAHVMSLCGIPQQNADGTPLKRYGKTLRAIAEEAVHKIYEHDRTKTNWTQRKKERKELARRFRKKYRSEEIESDGETKGKIQPYFIGVFDTVAALQINKWKKTTFYYLPVGLIAFYFTCLLFSASWIHLFTSSFLLGFSLLYGTKKHIRYIRDFPKKGDLSWHIISWGQAHYDHFLDSSVPYARHAISIDENRKDFQRVAWRDGKKNHQREDQGPVTGLKEVWFAGNHSDVGGSYPENESRLSDISLSWMLDQTQEVPHPVAFNKNLLNTFPDSQGLQHDEIEFLREKIWPLWWPNKYRISWPEQMRKTGKKSALHPSVLQRFQYNCISRCGVTICYRPASLAGHNEVQQYYSPQSERSYYISKIVDLRSGNKSSSTNQLNLHNITPIDEEYPTDSAPPAG